MKRSVLNNIKLFHLLTFCMIISAGCSDEWLEVKPTKSLVVPSTIADFQALLDNVDGGVGAPFNYAQSTLDEFSAGDYYITDNYYDTRTDAEKAAYTWQADIHVGAVNGISIFSGEWDQPYERIFYANVVLEGIDEITPAANQKLDWSQVKGSALFFRAYNHFSVAQIFCKEFDEATADSDLGIPVRTSSDVNIPVTRSSVEETYNQIVKDLKQALPLLPIQEPVAFDAKTSTRPNKAAVAAMLARVYLSMANYDSALVYADKSLQLYDQLMDFNTDVLSGDFFQILPFNKETLHYQPGSLYAQFVPSRMIVDQELYDLYNLTTDTRVSKFVFHNPIDFFNPPSVPRYLGSYTAFYEFFTGLATDEVFLIRAECYARKGNAAAALADLNTLWQKRWDNDAGAFQPITATDAHDALVKILEERRRELCFRGVRWSDLRRLNKEAEFATTLTRVVHGETFTLPPNSPRYVLPIPPHVIRLSGIQQNPR